MAYGLLISFDGLDSSGKATQTDLLIKHLKSLGHTVKKFETPDYNTPSGQELKARLQGKIGDWQNTPWQEKCSYFATNRAEKKEELTQALANGEIVIYDRYVPSSLTFIAAEADASREEVYQTIKQEEYEKNEMPIEDASIFLDVPPHISKRLLEGRKAKRNDDDEYTDDLEIQQTLYAEYEHLIPTNPERYIHITCTKNEKLLSIKDVENLVWHELTQRFPQLEQ